jgi:hypothetical protein
VSKRGRESNDFGAGGPSRPPGSWARQGRAEKVRAIAAATTTVPSSFTTKTLLPPPVERV